MKGIILAGGMGTRLRPLTQVTNKHLLPVYNKPMIMYPLDTLKRSGITDIMVVTGREHAGDFMNFLGSGRDHGVTLSYAIQDIDNGGIADALKSAELFSCGDSVAVILGDNIFTQDFAKDVQSFSGGAKVFFKKVANPSRFGVPVFDASNKRIIRIEEKPKKPKSAFAQTGFYMYDAEIFSIIKTLKPSARGELEITDANNIYLKNRKLSHGFVQGLWSDAGTIESLHRVSAEIAKRGV